MDPLKRDSVRLFAVLIGGSAVVAVGSTNTETTPSTVEATTMAAPAMRVPRRRPPKNRGPPRRNQLHIGFSGAR